MYRGNKLPPFYLGSSSVKRVKNGYRGSVESKKYSKIWKNEIKNNPGAFTTKIIFECQTQKEAVLKEKYLQEKLKVVTSPLYVNLSTATVNGFFGRDVSGENNPMFGKKGKNNPNYGSKRTQETKNKMKISNSRPMTEAQKKKLSDINKGKKTSQETKDKISAISKGVKHEKKQCPNCLLFFGKSIAKRYHFDNCGKQLEQVQCPHCLKIGGKNVMKRWHFDNCKSFKN
jgi:hypothetical protein